MCSSIGHRSDARTAVLRNPTAHRRAGAGTLTGERADLLEALRKHRAFLRFAAKELTDEQARARTTVSALTLGGLVKHVADVEAQWATFMVEGAGSAPEIDWESIEGQKTMGGATGPGPARLRPAHPQR